MPSTRGAALRSPRAWPRHAARIGRNDDRGEPAERRQHRPFPLMDLAFVESVGIAGHDRLHDRMLRLIGLQKAEAFESRPSGTSRHLGKELERPFRSARVAIGKTQIRIDDADQGHVREVVPLGDELRADDDVRLPAGDCLELQPQPLDPHQIGGEHDGARVGKVPLDLFGDALDPGAAGNEMIDVPHSGQASGVRSE